jgi:hypothetical protein
MCTCMHVQSCYFDHADQLGTSISIYHVNLIEFEQRIKKLVLHVFMCKNSNVCACIFRQNDLRSAHLQMLDYHPWKFHVDPLSSFWEHSQTKNGQKEELEMQLRAIADVAPVVTMASEAISVMRPTHCGHCFYLVLSQNVELYPRNMKWKVW